ncbi:MAG: DsbE family thiol:disulfide interchange protein [Magnetovibrio sp.]|nr:DsbE family thiol:disulfide interchange protein [Magnetovibrio sp.]
MLINREIPAFDLAPIKGSDQGWGSKDLAGQVTIVNFFGSWCIACLQEHPFLMNIKAQKLVPIYGADWREKSVDAGPRWLARYGNPYTRVGDDPKSKAAIAFGVAGGPESFIVDKKGVIRYKQVGPIYAGVWTEKLWPLIQELQKE